MDKSSNLPHKQCPLTLDEAMEYEMKHGSLFNNPNMDMKKIRRTVSNRLSAQRSRMKMAIYTRGMEKMVKDLGALIFIITSQVESNKENNKLLLLENDSLQQELDKRSNEYRRLELAIQETRAEIKVCKEHEKTAHKNKLRSDSKGKQWKDPRPSRGTEIKPGKEVKETTQEYEDVDKYINFDALSAVDAAEGEN